MAMPTTLSMHRVRNAKRQRMPNELDNLDCDDIPLKRVSPHNLDDSLCSDINFEVLDADPSPFSIPLQNVVLLSNHHVASSTTLTSPPSSILTSLSLDCLRSIFYFLRDHKLYKLRATGDKFLSLKMQEVVEELVLGHGTPGTSQRKYIDWWYRYKRSGSASRSHLSGPTFWWPFRRLKAMTILFDAPFSSMPTNLPSSLQSLSIQTSFKSSIWNDLMNSGNALNNLQSLSFEYVDSPPYNPNTILQNKCLAPRLCLPTSLRHSLHCLKIPSVAYSYSTSDLQPNLTIFEGCGLFVDFADENPMFGDPQKSFKLGWLSSDQLDDMIFPTTLTSFDFKFSSDFSISVTESFFGALPPTLLRLNLSDANCHRQISIRSSIFHILPATLQYLGLGDLPRIHMNFSQLPQTLRHWHCEDQPWDFVLKSEHILKLPPTLETMCFKDGFRSDRWGSKVDYSSSPLLRIHKVAWCCMGSKQSLFDYIPNQAVYSWWSPSDLTFSASNLYEFKSLMKAGISIRDGNGNLEQNQFLRNCSKLDICLNDFNPDGGDIAAFRTVLPQNLKKLRLDVLHMHRLPCHPSINLMFMMMPKSLTKFVFRATRLHHPAQVRALSFIVADLNECVPNLIILHMFARIEYRDPEDSDSEVNAVPAVIPFHPISIPQSLKDLSLCGFVADLIPLLSLLPESMETCVIDCFLKEYQADPNPAPLTRILPANVGAASNIGLEIGIRIVDLPVFLERNIGRTVRDIAERIREDNNHLRSMQISSYDCRSTKCDAQQSIEKNTLTVWRNECYYKRRE